jgi:hypothetical protein
MSKRAILKIVLFSTAFVLYLLPWYVIFGRIAGTPLGVDFGMLRSAAESAMLLQNPYTAGPGFYNPPWMLLIMALFAMIPQHVGFALWTVIGLACYMLAFRRMGIGWPAAVTLIFSPLAVGNLMFGNYDWLILLGATLPPAWAIWLMALKPQLGWVLASVWIWQSAKRGLRSFAIVVLPIATAVLVSFLLGYRLPDRRTMAWSADVWPWGIPAGAVLAYFAYRRSDPVLALAAAPFLSPYVVWHSWIVVLLPLARNRWALAAGILGSWILFWWAFAR